MTVPYLDETLDTLRDRLLAERSPRGCWTGRLSTSALATATAVTALAVAEPDRSRERIGKGLDWLRYNQNGDGGWGDSPESPSNLSTTVLAWSAFAAAGRDGGACVASAEAWIDRAVGGLETSNLVGAIVGAYGGDRTFSTPILAMTALAGRLGAGRDAWRHVPPLPYELGALSHRWLRRLRLPVVSYALPALIAVGRLRRCRLPPLNPITRLVRRLADAPALRKLRHIQPESGGFLEAPPLTAFVVMSLVSSGAADHPAVPSGLRFLHDTVRPDGGWPIDTDLATWLTSLSVSALAAGGRLPPGFTAEHRRATRDWLLGCQLRRTHPYTESPPGGWAWTDRSGGVPDADDTAGAMLALRLLDGDDPRCAQAAGFAADRLAGLQNRDGGIPTFCPGWGRLPFDRSAADLTAHAVAAWSAWPDTNLPPDRKTRIARAVAYLARTQRQDGAWMPLWFGNQHTPEMTNPVYGTARVLSGLCGAADATENVSGLIGRGGRWLLSVQRADGGFGGDATGPCSIEETALAVSALSAVAQRNPDDAQMHQAVRRGAGWLVEHTDGGKATPAAPIGLYFARLWYSEKLYPLIFSADALARAGALPHRPRGADT